MNLPSGKVLGARAASTGVTVIMLLVLAGLSQWPLSGSLDEAVIRLSWRTAPVRIEECRTLTEEELSRIAPHMRRPEECTGGFADYELRLEVEGAVVQVDTLQPSGLRQDRPVYVFSDHLVAPGTYEVAVTFSALVPADMVEGEAPLHWDGMFALEPGEIGLLTLDPTGSRLQRGTPTR